MNELKVQSATARPNQTKPFMGAMGTILLTGKSHTTRKKKETHTQPPNNQNSFLQSSTALLRQVGSEDCWLWWLTSSTLIYLLSVSQK